MPVKNAAFLFKSLLLILPLKAINLPLIIPPPATAKRCTNRSNRATDSKTIQTTKNCTRWRMLRKRMRSRNFFLTIGVIGIWIFVTLLLLARQNSDFSLYRRYVNKIDELENGVKSEVATQNELVHGLISILKAKAARQASTEKPPNEIVEELVEPDENFVKEIPLDNDLKLPSHEAKGFDGPVIPVLVFACNRISVKKCLDNLIEYRPNVDQFPIIVSQDCGDESTRNAILSYKDQLTLIQQPDLSDIPVPPKEKKFKGYYKIARHYGWALNTVFAKGYNYVIIVEDDLNVAPDFYEYFAGTQPLLAKDSSLWCVSAWNDNGKAGLIDTQRPDLLYRTDFFPGLGWMLSKELWAELSPKWPKSFWDDWIRHPQQRKNRACIRPEISRTRTFGKVGVSNGLFFDKYLKYIKLSEDFVHYSKMNLTYLLKENYDKTFLNRVYQCPIVTFEELKTGLVKTKDPVRIQYNNKDQYKRITKMLGLMDDFKSGVPRTGYHGIVSFFFKDQRVYLAPSANWKGYDLTWS